MEFALPVLFLVGVILLWELYVRVRNVPDFLLPAPSAIWRDLAANWSVGLRTNTWVTFQEAALGFIFGTVLALVLAIAIAYSKVLERALYPPIVASQAIPKLALAPIFVVWLGFGMAPKVFITVLLVFFPIVVTTVQGLKEVDDELIELFRSVRASTWQTFYRIRFPHAMPYLVSGMKIGVTLSVVGAVVGEWVGANEGLGYQILYSQSQLQTSRTFAAIMLLVVMGVVMFLAVDVIGRLFMPWAKSEGSDVAAASA